MIQGQLPLSFSPGLLSSGATGLGSLGTSSLLSTSGVNSFTGSLGGGLGSSLGLGGSSSLLGLGTTSGLGGMSSLMGLGATSGLGGTSSLMGLGTGSGLDGMSALGGLSAGGLMGAGAAGGTPNALGGYGGGYGGSAGAGAQGSGDFTQQIFSIISLMLQLLTTLLPQLLGGGAQQPGGQYNPGNPYDPGQGNGNGAKPPVTPEGPDKPGGGLIPGQGTKLGPNPPASLKTFQPEIEKASAASGVPASVLGAMIWQESRGNLQALSTNGGNGLTDTGLMQVNPNTYKELQTKYPELQGRDNLSDPETNILAGAFYMKDMIAQFGDIPTALRAYNSGPNGVDRNNLNALPAGTGDATYVDKVLSFANSLTQGGDLPP